MTDRERFEAWSHDQDEIVGLLRTVDGNYRDCAAFVAWEAWQASRKQALAEMATICEELESHYSAYKDTALLNGDVDLSNAASGEPRACRAIAEQVARLATPEGEQG